MIRPVTKEEHERGYVVCDCGKYAYVFRAAVLRTMLPSYNGELCPECNMWMVDVDMLKEGK